MIPYRPRVYNLGAGGLVGAAIVDLLHRGVGSAPPGTWAPTVDSAGPGGSWGPWSLAGCPVLCLEAAEPRLLAGLGLALLGAACLVASLAACLWGAALLIGAFNPAPPARWVLDRVLPYRRPRAA